MNNAGCWVNSARELNCIDGKAQVMKKPSRAGNLLTAVKADREPRT